MIAETAIVKKKYSSGSKSCFNSKKKNPVEKMITGIMEWWCL